MKTVLLTGFEPFGGESVNASWEAVSRLPESIGIFRLIRLCLPVVYGQCGELLRQAIRETSPDYVISVGVAGGRKAITPELLAVNYRMASSADNAGMRYDGVKIDENGPDAIMTGLPVREMVSALQEKGFSSALSLSAGSYVCNDLYYALLAGQQEGKYRGAFIHVPPESAQSFDRTSAGLEICLKLLSEREEKSHKKYEKLVNEP